MKRFASLVSVLFFLKLYTPANAAGHTVMSISPGSGNFTDPFMVSLVINGHGDIFNAAGATITKSDNVSIKDLSLGDCQFSFLKTPNTYNLSFEGVIMNSKQEKCTLYTATLVPIDNGEGFLKIYEATVKRYGDAAEILSYAQNGMYMLTKSNQADTRSLLPAPPASLEGLYTLGFKITSDKDTPINNGTVNITGSQNKISTEKKSDWQGLVYFTDLKPDVYVATISVTKYETTQTILNIEGSEQVVQLSMRMQPIKARQSKIIIVVMGSMLAVALLAATFRHLKNSKTKIKLT